MSESRIAGAQTDSTYPSEHLLYDKASRRKKAEKIVAMLREHLGMDLSDRVCLDVGCASGLITREIAQHMGYTVGLEYNQEAIALMAQEQATPSLTLIRGDAMALPIADESIDIVICAQVYEHVPDDKQMVREIWRVLRPGGVVFFSGPNRLDPIERHYGLPFVSWLPRPWADAFIRRMDKGDAYKEHPRTLWGLRRLWHQFEIRDYTLTLLKEPERFGVDDVTNGIAWISSLPHWALRMLYPLIINYNWILTKPTGHLSIGAQP